jgi:hypothetical protein
MFRANRKKNLATGLTSVTVVQPKQAKKQEEEGKKREAEGLTTANNAIGATAQAVFALHNFIGRDYMDWNSE